MKIRLLVLPAIILGLSGCSTMYYGTMRRITRLNDCVIHSFNQSSSIIFPILK